MAYLKSFTGTTLLRIENNTFKEFSGQTKYYLKDDRVKDFYGKTEYRIDGFMSRREMMALIAVLYG